MIKATTHTFLLLLLALALPVLAHTQTIRDSAGKVIALPDSFVKSKVDTLHSPRKAAIRSALIPGWGQAYNRRYWKIPIVYGALGTAGGIFAYNLKNYRQLRFAYRILVNKDSARFGEVAPRFRPFVEAGRDGFLRTNRDDFRRNIDYSVLAFIALWGLNVVDATVDAHLRSFDVSPDLSLGIQNGYSDIAGMYTVGLKLQIK